MEELKTKMKLLSFWIFLAFEDVLIGVGMIAIEGFYSYYRNINTVYFPPPLKSLHIPYFGFILIVIGAITLYQSLKKINIISIILNAFAWMYLFATSLIDLIDITTEVRAFNVILCVVALTLCIKIYYYSNAIDLTKIEKR